MPEMVYAVHTRTCTYLLDEEGVCGWVLSPAGDNAQDRCIGAQFVACLDLNEEGGLIGELRVGAAGLFARRERGRYVLLRTSTIEHVDFRRSTPQEIDPRASSADLSVTAALPDVEEMDARIEAARMERAQREAEARWQEPARSVEPGRAPDTQRLPKDRSQDERATRPEDSIPPYYAQAAAHQTSPPPAGYGASPSAHGSGALPPGYAHGVRSGAPEPYAAAAPGYPHGRVDDPETGPIPVGYGDEPQPYGAFAPQADAWPEPPPMVQSEQLVASSEELDVADLDELSTFSSEVTLTIPLYRPDPDEPPPRWGAGTPPAAWPPDGGRHRR